MSIPLVAAAIAETGRISIPTLADSIRGRLTMEASDHRLESWSSRLLRLARVELDVEGLEHARAGRAWVIMSNHQSHYDIPVLFQALPVRMRMITKTELFRIPIFGRAMRAAGFVEVDRSNRSQALDALRHARTALEGGTSIWIAPEGTRSRTGELGAFKKGGFHLAVDAAADILPVTLLGTREILPAGTLAIRRGARVRVVVGAPLAAGAYGRPRLEELMADVRRAIAGPLARP
ncbi:MAG: 1-acyl-sn-glycerol-3-phosphate acyltransferase [Polyangiaceae bacterium]|nr:1-acyl-sn-glycerol-3-phosphate acyltransferase [Polyangiaceae bacterium]